MPIYNRSNYLRRAWESLRASDLSGTLVLALDDASDEPEALELLENLRLPEQPVLLARRSFNSGADLGRNLQFAFDFLDRNFVCDYFAVLDSDTVVKPHWLRRMRELHQKLRRDHPRFLLTGFNAFVHRTRKNFPDYRIKRSFGGLSLMFARELYQPLVRSQLHSPRRHSYLWDWHLMQACEQQDIPRFCARPSVAQHIGVRGVWSQGFFLYDWALDYKYSLPLWIEFPVTLCLHLLYKISWRYNELREILRRNKLRSFLLRKSAAALRLFSRAAPGAAPRDRRRESQAADTGSD